MTPNYILYLMKNKQTRKYKISLEDSARSFKVFFDVRVLVASADVNLKRQMITTRSRKIMRYHIPEVPIAHQTIFFV